MLGRLSIIAAILLGAWTSAAAQTAAPAPDPCLKQGSTVVARPAAPGAAHGYLAAGSVVIPDDNAAALTLRQTDGAEQIAEPLRFEMFFKGPGGQWSKLCHVTVSRPTAEDGDAAAPSATPSYNLTTRVPENPGLLPYFSGRLEAVGYARGSAQPVLVAEQRVNVSRYLPTLALALAFTATFHLTASLMIWLARNRTIGSTAERQVVRNRRVSYVSCLNPLVMTADEFNRGSLANLQVLFFFALVGFAMTFTVLRTGILQNLSPSILYLLGIPALGGLGATVANLSRDRFSLANWAWLVRRGVFPGGERGDEASHAEGPRWTDLFMTDEVLDMPKLQALGFSLIVGVGMLVNGVANIATFDVPSNLLQILGLSQLVFVGGRFTQPTSVPEIDRTVTELRGRGQALIQAARTGHDVDLAGKPVAHTAARPHPATSYEEAKRRVPTAVQRYEETEEQVKTLLDTLTHRRVKSDNLRNPLEWT